MKFMVLCDFDLSSLVLNEVCFESGEITGIQRKAQRMQVCMI